MVLTTRQPPADLFADPSSWVGTAPPVPPGRTEENVQPSRVRIQVLDRLTVVCRRHARHAADQRWTGHPIGPHVIVFFYAEGRPDQAADEAVNAPADLRVATRTFLAGDDVTDLARMLTQLHDLALDYLEGDGLDARIQLANRVEPMTARADYVGVAVSTLVPPSPPRTAAPVGESAPRPDLAVDIPFRGVVQLVDGTQLVLRCGGGLQSPQVQSTHTLDLTTVPVRRWQWAGPRFLLDERGLAEVGAGLSALNGAVAAGHHSALAPGRRRRGRHH